MAAAATAAQTTAAQTTAAAATAPAGELEAVVSAAEVRFGHLSPRLWGDSLPGIVRSFQAPDAVLVLALTLDACGPRPGHSSFDADIIAYLRQHKIPATIFVTNSWMRANKAVLDDLARDPLFELAAHGARHRPCSVSGKSAFGVKGTASIREVVEEVEGNARALERATGRRPRWFRSGTAHYDDAAVEIIRWLGLDIAGFSLAADEGAALPAGEVARRVSRAKAGAIILCHLNHPESGAGKGLRAGLDRLREKGAVFVRLSDLPGLQ